MTNMNVRATLLRYKGWWAERNLKRWTLLSAQRGGKTSESSYLCTSINLVFKMFVKILSHPSPGSLKYFSRRALTSLNWRSLLDERWNILKASDFEQFLALNPASQSASLSLLFTRNSGCKWIFLYNDKNKYTTQLISCVTAAQTQ